MQVDRSLPGQRHPWGKAQRLVGDALGRRWAMGTDPASQAGGGCSWGLSLERCTWLRVGTGAPKIQLQASRLLLLGVARIWPPNQFAEPRGFGNGDHKECQVLLGVSFRAWPWLPGAPPFQLGFKGVPGSSGHHRTPSPCPGPLQHPLPSAAEAQKSFCGLGTSVARHRMGLPQHICLHSCAGDLGDPGMPQRTRDGG